MACSSLFHVPRSWPMMLPSNYGRVNRRLLLLTSTHLCNHNPLSHNRLLAVDYCCNDHPTPTPTPTPLSSSLVPQSARQLNSGTSGEEEFEDDEVKQKRQEEEAAAAAREAVSEILQDNGVSKEESVEISINSPKYLKMLMEGVRELDDFQFTNADTDTYTTTTTTSSYSYSSYKKKIYELGLRKGDKGLVPLLESMVGLSLPFAIRIARYLSAHTPPPSLLQKVKYVKEILFSENDGKLPIGRTGSSIMMHLSVPIDEDLQHTLSFLEKIQARRGGLDLLGSGDGSFRYLIESFPRLLLLSVESHMKPMIEFLEYNGVPKGCIRNILLLFPPILFYDIKKDIKPRMQVIKKVYGGEKEFGRMLLKYPWVLSTSILENYADIVAFFNKEKVTEVSIFRAIKSWPLLLGCSVGKLKLMVDQFRELGVTEMMLDQVIAKSPQLLVQKPQDLWQVVSFLKGLGLEDMAIAEILGRCPEIFMTSIEGTLKKKVEFLYEIGVSKDHLPGVIRKYPELFVCDVSKALLPRIKYLLKIGLSDREVAFMVCGFSPLLGYSIEEVLRPKYEFLVNTMGRSLKEVVEYPRYFSYSLEKKIKPRYWIIKSMNCECSLKDILGKNDEEFAAEYISGVGTTYP